MHIHSRYSRATSKEGTPEYLDLWARKKGISIVGTGDFTHHAWREELNEKLTPAENGFYKLKEEYVLEEAKRMGGEAPRFVITGEISSIYKKNDRVRKVHNVLLLPGLEDGEKLARKLETIGNIHSDGRPILGLDCRNLLEIMLELCPRGMLVPAHIWTPHFALFGAFSGFDTMEECFEDLTPYIHAVETGLSSDPPMNWRLSALDRFQLVSNSDAHSPAKLGREANLLDIDFSYDGLYGAVQEGKGLEGTVEFFPEEGKYHYDGHRKCHICLSPAEAEKYNGKCPVCGRKMTIGVDHRVVELADREEGFVRKNAKPFESLVPLPEVIAASTGRSAASRKVLEEYEEILGKLGPEFEILRQIPIEDIKKESGYLIAEGIRRLRAGQVIRRPGFDGEYGTIKLFENHEIQNLDGQISLFGTGEWMLPEAENNGKSDTPFVAAAGTMRNQTVAGSAWNESQGQSEGTQNERQVQSAGTQNESQKQGLSTLNERQVQLGSTLNERQQQAVEAIDRAVAVIAGPGTGKTKTLVSRILYLLENRKVKPSEITAVTFTNQAAAEMKERLTVQLGSPRSVQRMNIGTFHAVSLDFLKKKGMDFLLAGEEETRELAKEIIAEYGLDIATPKFLQSLSSWKVSGCEDEKDECFAQAFAAFREKMRDSRKLDFDDLLLETLRCFKEAEKENDRKKQPYEQPFTYLLVDEFQDISPLQYELILAWNARGRELFAIGDPDQSIYGFRGSDAHCFERLQKDYPELKVIHLEENYRSSGKILSAATAAISNNPGGDRFLHANRPEGVPVRIVKAAGKMPEAIFAAKEINRLIGGIDMVDVEQQDTFREEKRTWTFRDIAILYRTHHQARLLEKCLSQEGIPYLVTGREDFLEKPLLRGTIAFFHSLLEPEKKEYAIDAGKLLWNLDTEASDLESSIYGQMAEKYRTKWKRSKPKKLLETWMEDLERKDDNDFINLAHMGACYNTMAEFLDALLLGEEGDLKRCGGKSYSADSVRLMTLHGSKGLEFPVVILFGVGKGELPLENEKYPSDVEEERRLFYVGMTRAKEELIITYAGEPSEFLEELPKEDTAEERAGKKHAVEAAQQLSLFDFL